MARPLKDINWAEVEKRMEAGNSAKQIASACRIDEDTFYIRFKKEYGCGFQDYSGHYSQCGYGNVAFMQYMQAMKGNTNMLTLLGKEWLGQGKNENNDTNITIKVVDARNNNTQEVSMPTIPECSVDGS